MEFWEGQEQAKRATGSLLFHFTLGFLGVVLLVVFCAMLLLMPLQGFFRPPPGEWAYYHFRWPLFWVGIITALVMLLASWMKIRSLRKGGGESLAMALGGRLLRPNTTDPLERRLQNVVSEMSLAANTTPPIIFLLDREQGINAFAAGFHPEHSVLGITRGALELFNRDELQAVIGHEFSHIVNGDMRLNLRLIGLVYGIEFLALTGHKMMSVSLNDDGDPANSTFSPGAVIGFMLFAVGSFGGFSSACIKAAVCRQREFLADATSVQFTRNDKALVSALEKIGGCTYGGSLITPMAPLASHMYFANGLDSWLGRTLATHPPLEERIRRIDPSWQGSFPKVDQETRQVVLDQARVELAGVSAFATLVGTPSSVRSHSNMESTPGDRSLRADFNQHASRIMERIPRRAFEAARDAKTAPLLVYALVLARCGQDSQHTLSDLLLQRLDLAAYDQVEKLAQEFPQERFDTTLPLFDLALPTVLALPREELSQFQATLQELMRSDRKLDLFQWTLSRVLRRYLAPGFAHGDSTTDETPVPLSKLSRECGILLSALIHWGGRGRPTSSGDTKTLANAVALLTAPKESPLQLHLTPKDQVNLRAVDQACDALARLSAPRRERLLRACVACVTADQEVTRTEAELLRAVSAALDLPMPPLLPGQLLL